MQVNIYDGSFEKSVNLEKKYAQQPLFHQSPQTIIETRDEATLLPGFHALYDENGHRIAASLLWRDRRRHFDVWPNTSPGLTDISHVEDVIEGPCLYAGPINPHFGHFMIEFTSRLWAAKSVWDPNLKIIYSRMPHDGPGAWERDYFRALLGALELPADRVVMVSRPTRLRQVFIPYQSFFLQIEAYSNHVTAAKLVAEHTLLGKPPTLTERPAYLSMTQFTPRPNTRDPITNELALENELRARGVDIYYPEKLTLSERIHLVNSHKWIILLRGSGLYSMLFSLVPQQQSTCVIVEDRRFERLNDSLLVDHLTSISGHYLIGMTGKNENPEDEKSATSYEINVKYVVEWLRDKKVI